jgi:hypothetical protein
MPLTILLTIILLSFKQSLGHTFPVQGVIFKQWIVHFCAVPTLLVYVFETRTHRRFCCVSGQWEWPQIIKVR